MKVLYSFDMLCALISKGCGGMSGILVLNISFEITLVFIILHILCSFPP